LTDAEIIKEVRSGNIAAFEEIVTSHESLVAATVKGMLGNTAEAEDVGQEVFIRFFKALGSFRGEASVGTYLSRIAINLSLNELRRRKRRNLLFFKPSEDDYEITAPKNDNDEKEILYAAIDKLEADFRSVVVLRLIDGYSTKETAAILNIPVGTVLSRLARAQKKLYKILSPVLEVDNG